MQEVTFILGANLSNKEEVINLAISFLEWNIGALMSKSSLYESPAWGYESTNDYLNQVVVFKSELAPEVILEKAMRIEKVLGRKRESEGYADRVIDIDILTIEAQIINTENLIVPHPRLHLRRFCLLPLAEVKPDWEHPILKQTVSEMISNCTDTGVLTKRTN